MRIKHYSFFYTNAVQYCTKPKLSIKLEEDVTKNLENELYKPRHHPGVTKINAVTLPQSIMASLVKVVKDIPIKSLLDDGQILSRYLTSRHPPTEYDQYKMKKNEIEQEIIDKNGYNFDEMEESQKDYITQIIGDKVKRALKQKLYAWKPINYDSYKALQYLFARSPNEYAVLYKIMSEIRERDKKFTPRSFFDFGSGVGTGTWATSNIWDKSIYEYFLCDSSREMNELSDLILRGGVENAQLSMKNIFYRQFLPTSNTKYDIVLSAYSLFELSSKENRLKTLRTLWNKCDKYFIIVEQGTNAGFQLVNEARDFILHLEKDNVHVFSPCPHDMLCPRIKSTDGTPCNYQAVYRSLPFNGSADFTRELYSYVVIKKESRNQTDLSSNWPRIVRPTLVRTKHSVCRLCTSNGKLQEVIITAAKNGKFTYRCARSSGWGDRLPVTITSDVENKDREND